MQVIYIVSKILQNAFTHREYSFAEYFINQYSTIIYLSFPQYSKYPLLYGQYVLRLVPGGEIPL